MLNKALQNYFQNLSAYKRVSVLRWGANSNATIFEYKSKKSKQALTRKTNFLSRYEMLGFAPQPTSGAWFVG